jgi:hypothetical protein
MKIGWVPSKTFHLRRPWFWIKLSGSENWTRVSPHHEMCHTRYDKDCVSLNIMLLTCMVLDWPLYKSMAMRIGRGAPMQVHKLIGVIELTLGLHRLVVDQSPLPTDFRTWTTLRQRGKRRSKIKIQSSSQLKENLVNVRIPFQWLEYLSHLVASNVHPYKSAFEVIWCFINF